MKGVNQVVSTLEFFTVRFASTTMECHIYQWSKTITVHLGEEWLLMINNGVGIHCQKAWAREVSAMVLY